MRRALSLLVLSVGAFLTAASGVVAAPQMAAPPGPLEKQKGWTFVTYSDETAVYMKRHGPPAKSAVKQVWTAYDSPNPRDRQGFTFKSVASLGEYDCAKGASRVIFESFHEKQNLTGRKWSQPDFHATEWAKPAKGTVGEQRLEFACTSVTA
jgi:hypothetical protein